MYAKRFDIEQYISYNTEVLMVKKAEGFTRYGRWDITTRDKSTGKEKHDTFDYVIVCTGHHAQKYMPTFPGIDSFQGKVLHSHEYRTPKGLEDQRVLVIGIGNSGGDVAVELSRCSKQVFLSTRQGTWIFNRVSEIGLPLDMLLTTRFLMYLKDQVSFYLANKLVKWRLNMRMDHKLYRYSAVDVC
ncbi:dimethylaniline monooxygenase [n-oxide-forming] [Plakobranchus ocellatus]|uniref:Flavin-containing monooxygenase n=1 Tax=Plakobranchus ocellatus TaxID=259542 RepID=A0AAV4DWS9_9GAST|nr:dimethylaniline monooxygenase [n-oxide-forming] [Plakobranchus ocellatus]